MPPASTDSSRRPRLLTAGSRTPSSPLWGRRAAVKLRTMFNFDFLIEFDFDLVFCENRREEYFDESAVSY